MGVTKSELKAALKALVSAVENEKRTDLRSENVKVALSRAKMLL